MVESTSLVLENARNGTSLVKHLHISTAMEFNVANPKRDNKTASILYWKRQTRAQSKRGLVNKVAMLELLSNRRHNKPSRRTTDQCPKN